MAIGKCLTKIFWNNDKNANKAFHTHTYIHMYIYNDEIYFFQLVAH